MIGAESTRGVVHKDYGIVDYHSEPPGSDT
jgi:hypothetical protein